MLHATHRRFILILWLIAMLLSPLGLAYPVNAEPEGYASWYGRRYAGRKTANGEIFNPLALTAAHRELPFGTQVRVTNAYTNQSVTVRINDRGPFIDGRIIDLSEAAAERIGMRSQGVLWVRLEILESPPPPPPLVPLFQAATQPPPATSVPSALASGLSVKAPVQPSTLPALRPLSGLATDQTTYQPTPAANAAPQRPAPTISQVTHQLPTSFLPAAPPRFERQSLPEPKGQSNRLSGLRPVAFDDVDPPVAMAAASPVLPSPVGGARAQARHQPRNYRPQPHSTLSPISQPKIPSQNMMITMQHLDTYQVISSEYPIGTELQFFSPQLQHTVHLRVISNAMPLGSQAKLAVSPYLLNITGPMLTLVLQ